MRKRPTGLTLAGVEGDSGVGCDGVTLQGWHAGGIIKTNYSAVQSHQLSLS